MNNTIAAIQETPCAVTPETLSKLRFLQNAELSPDDRYICAVISEYNSSKDSDIHHLWLYPLDGEAPYQLTQHNGINSNPTWSPDGKLIAFTSNRGEDGKLQIYILPVAGGEARQLTTLPQGVTGALAWSPDGQMIAFSTGRTESANLDSSDPYRVTRHVYRFDAIGYLDQQVHDLYVVAIDSGKIWQLTDDGRHNTNPRWSPDSQKILCAAMLPPDAHNGIFPQLHMVDLSHVKFDLDDNTGDEPEDTKLVGTITELVNASWGDTVGSATWLPDGQSIVFLGTPAGLPIGSKSDLYTVNVNGAEPVNHSANALTGVGGGLQADMPSTLLRQPDRLLSTADGKFIYGRVQIGGTLHLYQLALDETENRKPILEGDKCLVSVGLTSDEKRLVYAASDINSPWDLFIVDLESGVETQLSDINGAVLNSLPQTEAKHLRYPSTDGVEVEGWLFRHEGTDGALPTILYIHGGPHSAFGHIYHCDTQLLMSAGYAVLMINHRASMGYGDAFSTAIKGDWGNLDYADLMAGVDAAIEAGLADEDRLGVCGLSGGGNLSCWIVGQTGRFKAAVPENPLTNWSSFYGVSDIGVWFGVEELGGHLHEIPETYIRCSPITYAHSCTTPTLMVQCESDWRCPAEQSEQFYNVLKANGCTVEMLRLPGGSHGGCVVGPPKLRRAQNEALLDWMIRFV